MKQVFQRMNAPTPRFFTSLRTIGLVLTGVSAAILATPAALPPVVTKIAEWLAIAGAVASAVSQMAIKNEQE